jgi:hypothetical protein
MADTIVDRALRQHGLLSGSPDPTTPAEALARRRELLDDETWRAKVAAGDPEALDQIERLSRMIVGEPSNWNGRR